MIRWTILCATSFVFGLGQSDHAIGQEVDAPEKLIVATKVSPPFSFKRADGSWTGISIELWRRIAEVIGVEYEFRELELKEFFVQLESKEIDAAIAAISITPERDRSLDFSHGYFSTGLGVAVPASRSATFFGVARGLMTVRFFKIVGGLLLLAVVAGLVFWRLERKRNEGMFGGRQREGVGMGMWWATIILLGHKGVIPATTSGRLFAGMVMIASTIAVSVLTGVIASAMTLANIGPLIGHPDDLRHLKTGTVSESTSSLFLDERHVRHRDFPTIDLALKALASGEIDAVVYDVAMLKYRKNTDFASSIDVLPWSFNAQQYAIALQPQSELRKPVNLSLLEIVSSDEWADILFKYLGE